jgi:hypothetical protein
MVIEILAGVVEVVMVAGVVVVIVRGDRAWCVVVEVVCCKQVREVE